MKYVWRPLLFIGLAPSAAATAQDAYLPEPAQVPAEIRSQQRELERLRRDHLPITPPSYGSCDIRIGTDCYWLSGEDPNPNHPDHELVVTKRRQLLDQILGVGPLLRDSPWLHGTLVRYEVERGQLESALLSTVDCGGDITWWCTALRGYAYHRNARFDLAEAAFDTALTQMDPSTRCNWSDLEPLLAGSVKSAYRKLTCEVRQTLHDRVLWLADPLYLTPGNEVWTDHLSRHVWSALTRDSETASESRWDRNTHRGIVRYGLPVWWSKDQPTSFSGGMPRVIWHHEPESYYLFPLKLSNSLSDIEASHWRFDARRPESWHAIGNGLKYSEELSHEISRFPRHDRQIVVVGIDVRDDDLIAQSNNLFGVYVSSGPGGTTSSQDTTFIATAAMSVEAPASPALVSIEVVDDAQQHARRARYGLPTFDDDGALVRVSDLMVIGADSVIPADLSEAVSRYRSNQRFRAGQSIDLYWEVLLEPGDAQTVTATLRLERTNRSALRRLLESTPLASRGRPVNLEWVETLRAPDGIFRWGQTVTLPANLDQGSYLITLMIKDQEGQESVRERTIVVGN